MNRYFPLPKLNPQIVRITETTSETTLKSRSARSVGHFRVLLVLLWSERAVDGWWWPDVAVEFRCVSQNLVLFCFVLLFNKSLNEWSLGEQYFFPRISMFPETKWRETLRFSGNKIHCSPRDQSLIVKCHVTSNKRRWSTFSCFMSCHNVCEMRASNVTSSVKCYNLMYVIQ